MTQWWKLGLVILAAGCAFLFYSETRVSEHLVLSQNCAPIDARMTVSAFLYGDDFWKVQLQAVSQTREKWLRGGVGINQEHAQEQRLEQISWLSTCETIIRGRLRH